MVPFAGRALEACLPGAAFTVPERSETFGRCQLGNPSIIGFLSTSPRCAAPWAAEPAPRQGFRRPQQPPAIRLSSPRSPRRPAARRGASHQRRHHALQPRLLRRPTRRPARSPVVAEASLRGQRPRPAIETRRPRRSRPGAVVAGNRDGIGARENVSGCASRAPLPETFTPRERFRLFKHATGTRAMIRQRLVRRPFCVNPGGPESITTIAPGAILHPPPRPLRVPRAKMFQAVAADARPQSRNLRPRANPARPLAQILARLNPSHISRPPPSPIPPPSPFDCPPQTDSSHWLGRFESRDEEGQPLVSTPALVPIQVSSGQHLAQVCGPPAPPTTRGTTGSSRQNEAGRPTNRKTQSLMRLRFDHVGKVLVRF
jgi:hypothetical protein